MATITALMTTYNASRWVEVSIASILSQTFIDFELLIIDDGSNDRTTQIINSFNDKRIRLISNSGNKGVGVCLDQALSLINTPYIAKVDADDISLPCRFEEQLNYLREHDFDIVKCFLSYFADDECVQSSARFKQFKSHKERLINSVSQPNDIARTLLDWPCFPHTTYFAKTEPLQRVGYPHLRMFEDYVLFLRLLNAGYNFGCVEKPLVNMRISDFSVTASLSKWDLEQGLSFVVDEKWNRLSQCLSNKSLYIFGTGQIARAFARLITERKIGIEGFVEKTTTKKVLNSDGIIAPIISLEDYLALSHSVLVIAAQPVREELIEILEGKMLQKNRDFFILA
ncbi:glycosyltransferase [Alteromonas sp. 1_MG-2023]|uniref:glycosyltransferase family 2 protein n=1 Tax=Alteromonas sp. 1_MG-2023 TaxID=3062669 RepID=UPI0026E2146E|nr:glycosyltransferase [Alteromonas sp. 1_MG-2023]MDO6568450.1 glycosyltransferase [Alteromonas sp. 1_MG-2023]